MKASELKPRQFFHFTGDSHKQLCRNIGNAYQFLAEEEMNGNEEVIPLDVQGWDDEAKGEPDGVSLIAAERQRQIGKEGWSAEHDDSVNRKGELAKAAICYAATSYSWSEPNKLEQIWPYDSEWWKPSETSSIRNLVKAGALIAAEIDRLQRMKPAPPKLQLREGGWYRTQDQRTIGPAKFKPQNRYDNYPWCLNGAWYNDRGQYCAGCSGVDLIAEVPPPTQAELQPDADGWIAWSGGECPVDGKQLVQTILDHAGPQYCSDQRPADCFYWNHAGAGDITHYRIVKPTPNPTHWTIVDGVEVNNVR